MFFFQTLILDQKGNVVLLTRAPDLRQAQNTSIIGDIRIWVDKDGSNPANDLKTILDELNLKGKRLGIEYEAYGLTGRTKKEGFGRATATGTQKAVCGQQQ